MSDPEVAREMEGARAARLTRPRPGHADFAGMLKYGHTEARPVLERSSARETAARVAAGTVARSLLREVTGAEVVSHVISIGRSTPAAGRTPTPADVDAVDASPVRTLDPEAERSMIAEIDAAKKSGTPSAGSSRSSSTACPSASAATSAPTGGSTAASPARS